MGQHDETPDVRGSGDLLREEAGRCQAREILKKSLGELEVSEKLLIWRRREGLSQEEAGTRLGVHRKKYGEIEREPKGKRINVPHIGELYSHEICYLLRRRSGLTIPACAEDIGVSRYWYNLMELGKASPERLVKYWIHYEG